MFKGRKTLNKDINNTPESITHRKLTWCDIFYMAAVEATKNSHILITRYPVNVMSAASASNGCRITFLIAGTL